MERIICSALASSSSIVLGNRKAILSFLVLDYILCLIKFWESFWGSDIYPYHYL